MALFFTLGPSAYAVPFVLGDVVVGGINGKISHFDSAGVLKQTLDIGINEDVPGLCFDSQGNLYATSFNAGIVTKFDSNGVLVAQPFGGPGTVGMRAEGCVVNANDEILVGRGGSPGDLRKFDTSGTLLATYSPSMGTGYIDLACDQCTLFYTSASADGTVRRYDICNDVQLPDFATGMDRLYGIRVRENGEVLVVESGFFVSSPKAVRRFDSSGVLFQSYDLTTYFGGDLKPCALELNPAETSFWTAPRITGSVKNIDIGAATVNQTIGVPNNASSIAVFRTRSCGGCVTPPSGMISWWSGDICTPDDILGPNDGSYIGFPVCSIYWKVGGGALHFDESNPDHVVVPHNSSLDFGNGSFSIDAWIRTEDANGTIMAKGDLGYPGFRFYISGGRLGFSMCDPMQCYIPVLSSATVDDLTWRHVAVTVDRQPPGGSATTITLYVDGVADGTQNLTVSGSPDNTEPLLMGGTNASGTFDFYEGQLDEVELFGRTLTAMEVASLYAADSAGKCKDFCITPPPDMAAWYPFDETSGVAANEVIDNIDGVHVGGPTPDAGMVDGSLLFDGTNDYVEAPDDPATDFADGVFSVDFWIHPDPGEVGGTVVMNGEAAGFHEIYMNSEGYHIYYHEGHFFLYLQGTGSGFVIDISPNFTHHADPGEWTFVAITVDLVDGEIRLYINDELARVTALGPLGLGSLDNTEPMRIGGQTIASPGRAFDGRLDELEFFGRILSPEEILDIYEAGAAGKCKDDAGLPWDKAFCRDQEKVSVPVRVCNYSSQSRTYELSFQSLPAGTVGPGGSCGIDGPTDFFAPPSTPIPPALVTTVPPFTCQSVPVLMLRPADMDTVYEVGCYEATIRNVDTGLTQRRRGSVQDRRDLCAVIGGGGGGDGFVALDDREAAAVGFELSNTSGRDLTLRYQIQATEPDMVTPARSLSVNGREPGEPYRGLIRLAPREGAELWIELEAVGPQPFGFRDLVLSTVSEGGLVPLTSVGVHRPPAGKGGDVNSDKQQ